MTGLATYMWKEWRDQRVQVIGYALLVPLLMALALLAIPGEWSRMDAMPTFVAIGGLLIGALTIASDTVPGELRRGRLEFLARLPCDLRAPFVAKLLFVALALAGFCVYAWFCATTLSAALAGGRWFAPFEWVFQYRVQNAHESHTVSWSMVDPLIVLAAWIFAVSCWLPRGTLTLPAAAIVLALIGGPTALILLEHRGLSIHPEEMSALRLWLPATALLAATLSFLRGARHGRAPLRMAGWTLVGTLFAAAPVWAWTANRWHDYVALDLTSDSLALEPVALGDGGRFVFANVRPRIQRYRGSIEDEAVHPVVVDLESGTARSVGEPDTFLELPWRQQSIGTTPLALVGSGVDATNPRAAAWGFTEWTDGLDGRNGTRLTGEQWKRLLQRKESLGDSIVRSRDFLVTADGARCWMTGRTVHVEARDGTASTWECKTAPADVGCWRPCGAGFRSLWSNGFVDLARRNFLYASTVRTITSRCLDGTEAAVWGDVVAIREGAWLLRLPRGPREKGEKFVHSTYALWTPGEAAARPAAGLGDFDAVIDAFADGRVLVASALGNEELSKRELELFVVDPESGVRLRVALPSGLAAPNSASFAGRLRSGALVAVLQWSIEGRDWPTRVARIGADGEWKMTAALPSSALHGVVGCPDEETVIVLVEDRKIVRAHFDGSPYEVVFPREEAHR